MTIDSLSSATGLRSIIGLDQVVAMADHLGLNIHAPAERQLLHEMIEQMTMLYSSGVTAVSLAPELGYSAVQQVPDKKGVVFPLERRLYDPDPLSLPVLVSGWGVEAVRNNYAVAKLELFYNPEEKEALTKKQMVAELYDYCNHEGIDLLLELVLYIEGTVKEYETRFLELQLTAIQELRKVCSLMAIEYPLSPLGAVTVTAELDIPWIVTARDTPYETFKEQLRSSLESGASGYLAMEQFLPPKPAAGSVSFNKEKCLEFCTTTGRDRVLELARILEESK